MLNLVGHIGQVNDDSVGRLCCFGTQRSSMRDGQHSRSRERLINIW
jgi:hypothetical protein